MLEFLMSGRRPDDPRELLAQILARFPTDHEKARRVFTAAILDDRRCVRACIERAFETWRSRAPQ